MSDNTEKPETPEAETPEQPETPVNVMREKVADLEARRAKGRAMGGEKRIAKAPIFDLSEF